MGVADNKTYKDTYFFNSMSTADRDDYKSLNVSKDINSTIKENKESSNVEIEGGENVLKPNLTALFRAVGKKHFRGGMKVNLEPGSFIFSDDKSLKINDKEKELFEFKKGGTTPSDLVNINVNPKHYNTLINNIMDPKKDDLARNSSTLMLEKYIGTLSKIAYLQESKKGFPQGLPSFAQGAGDIFQPEIKNNMEQQEQFQQGGQVPSFFKFWDKPLTPNGDLTPTGQRSRYVGGVNNLYEKYNFFKEKNGGKDFSSAEDFQKFLLNYATNNNPDSVKKMWDKYGQTAALTFFDGKLGRRTAELMNYNYPGNEDKIHEEAPERVSVDEHQVDRDPVSHRDPLQPNSANGPLGDQWKSADWQFTPWQKASQLYNFGKYAGLNKYNPYRSHLNPSYVDPSLVNPEQTLGDMRTGLNIAGRTNLNPILESLQQSNAHGQFLDKAPGVRSQYDNQNVGILNNIRSINNQISNTTRATNMQNDQQYHQDVVKGNTHHDNMKTFLGDQYMNNVMDDVSTNQTLAYNMMAQKNPAWKYDFKTGKYLRNPKQILDVENNDQTATLNSLLADLVKNMGSATFGDKVRLFRSMMSGK
jgi:hypothetical protein